ncbi:hypothetical protein UA75_29125 [Actinoalloteichus sp. GBA129-24]|uniref:Uncharacterized protein n=1 Tax=Actinoalloteichus fjordicus TaxID=1612552 RepID=A0AAC9LGZ7_9PSEU|nr:hypothetical protein UA74_28595 [Actinoalloteichus fjordicus]APU23796.1 hypothetical protein UA75_29125 [Actinoalloteichus sp. GBA129-24]
MFVINDEILEGVMEVVEDDYLDMTDIMSLLREQTDDVPSLLRIAAIVAEHVVITGRVVPGDLTDEGLIPWPTSPRDSAARIVAEANSQADEEREVYPGDIAWFDLPRRVAARAAGDDPAAPRA